jgi:hypothetical protein
LNADRAPQLKAVVRFFFFVAMNTLRLLAACLLASLLGACTSDLRTTLKLGRLADLPQSAIDLKIDGTSNLFSSTYHVRFEARSEDIEKFIRNSPGLNGLTPTKLDAERQLLPFLKDDEQSWDDGQEHFWLDERYPWFNPTIKTRGRKYKIPQDHDANSGEVIINDETNVVYITVSHS